ncbi:hypothetical protein [Pelagibius sp. Alg239-R121]|nr:hypothetical protein [Pelagibius sp. Alg239-R121]
MKAFWASVIAAIAISVVAAVALDMADFSAESVHQSQNGSVRL